MKIRLSSLVQTVLDQAYADAKARGHEYVTPEHVLLASLDHPAALKLLSLSGADIAFIHENVDEYLRKNIPVLTGNAPVQTIGFQNVFQRAVLHCESAEKPMVEISDILVSLLDESRNYSSYFMRRGGLDRLVLLEIISHGGMEQDAEGPARSSRIEENIDGLSGQDQEGQDSLPFGLEDASRPESTGAESDRPRQTRKSALERFTVELTALARQGRLEPLIGRVDELDRTIQVLCRRMKNNPIHVGDAGVGKTAITEGLAQRIVEGSVPSLLKGYEIYSLDMGALVAGTKFRGDFEDRIKKVTDDLLRKEKAILFIDEIHTIIGAGSTGGGTLDASNLLKPVLTSGKIRCIGSTTFDEYNRYFEKDHALSRRFQKIDIPEPSPEDSIAILQGLRKRYEEFHRVSYSEDAISSAVHLSALYITERRLPDKAIDVIDEAGAQARIRGEKTESGSGDSALDGDAGAILPVDSRLVEQVVAKIARIPERTVSAGENDRLRELEPVLSRAVFGQASAVAAVVKAVKRSRAGFRAPNKPVANFLFVGPTGVGKTELARTLSSVLGIALHRFDMSEYQEKHTVSRLIGSPPGYVGFEEGGLLTDVVRKQPHAVVLLDEIEKAHTDIFNILLQIMDYATLTDNQGRKADFRNVILIMTSNAGAREIGKPLIGFGEREVTAAAVQEAVDRTFTPEFRNRLDAVVTFGALSAHIMQSIVRKELSALQVRLNEKSVQLDVTDAAVARLAELGYSPEFGARNAARLIEEQVTTPLVDSVLFGELSGGGIARCDVDAENGITVTTVPDGSSQGK